MRLALFGSPTFALPVLEALRDHHDLALVVAQPDKPAGRGNKLTPPPVAARARELGLRLEQPPRLKKNEEFLELIRDLKLEVAITAAYGKILPQALLDIPQHGFLNVHASLLPKYRGAAPIQWAIIDGEKETGVSIMQTEAGLDTGAVRLESRLDILPDDTAPSLFERLSSLGVEALLEALAQLEKGTLPLSPQDDSLATHAPMLTRDDGRILWEATAESIYNRYRGTFPWPGTWTVFGERTVKVHALEPQTGTGQAGEILELSPEGVLVAAGEGAILLKTVQPPDKPRMDARAWANGYAVREGMYFV